MKLSKTLGTVFALALIATVALGDVLTGSQLQNGGGGSNVITPGGTPVDGGVNGGVFFEASDLVSQDADFTYINDVLLLGSAGAGTNAMEWQKTMAGGATTDNFLRITGTLPSTLTAATYAAKVDITPAGSSVQDRVALGAILNSGQTAGGDSAAIYGLAIGANANNRVAGVWGAANCSSGTACAGVIGHVNGGTNQAAGFFLLGGAASDANPLPIALDTYVGGTVALAASNGAVASDIFRLYDNTTLQYVMVDGGMGTFTNRQTFSGGLVIPVGTDLWFDTALRAGFSYDAGSTPNTWQAGVGALSNSLHFMKRVDLRAFDFNNGRAGTGANTNPSLIFHSDQSTTEYMQLQVDTTGAGKVQNNFAEITVGGTKSNITEGAGQAIVRITMPSAGIYSAFVTYLISDSDGTDHVGRGGTIQIQGANKAGTSVCTINTARDTEAEDGSQIVNAAAAFTLTYTWTNVVNTTSCDLTLNAASSAGTNTYDITYTVVLNGNSSAITVNPQ